MASVAASLAAGHGFSSPYWIPTGPTALVPPVYPFLLTLVFRVFGNHELLAGRRGKRVALARQMPSTGKGHVVTTSKATRLLGAGQAR